MPDLKSFALNLLMSDPNLRNNNQTMQYIRLIQNNDAANGARVAQNLCDTFGMTRDEAIAKARSFFNL